MHTRIGYCPICQWPNVPLTRHHKLKKYIFHGRGRKVWICRECHNAVEWILSRGEEKILRGHEEMYLQTIDMFLTHKIDVREVLKMMQKGKVKAKDEDVEEYADCIYWGGEFIPREEFARSLLGE